MRGWLSLVVGVVFLTCAVRMSSQSKPVLVVEPFTAAAGVELPYDLKQMQGQLVASLKVEIGKDGHISRIAPRPRFDSHRLIEEFMIAANVAAAETLEARRTPCMYRVHDAPDPAKVAADFKKAMAEAEKDAAAARLTAAE